jgi:uncharacterized repeat protein (TIGR01451 family)
LPKLSRSARRAATAAFLAASAVVVMAWPQPVSAAPGESTTPDPNPPLQKGCGIDIQMVLDESGSVSNYANNVKQAFRAFTSAVQNTGSTMAVSDFSTVAQLPLPGAANRAFTPVTNATIASIFEPYISTGYNPNGSTHWEDALRVGRYFLPRPSATRPSLVVFITDGDPNRVVVNTSQAQYETQVPLNTNQTQSTDENTATTRAVPNANALKQQGSHMFVVAVGSGLNDNNSLNRLKAISGPNVYTGTGPLDITTTDIYRVADFSQLEEAMRQAAFALCAPSVTIRKLVDLTPDPGPDDSIPGQGWGMSATVTPTPVSWTQPAGATGGNASATTDGNGFANFQWQTSGTIGSTMTLTESPPANAPPGLVNDTSATRCTFRTPQAPVDKPLPLTATNGGFTTVIPYQAIVTCEMVNRATAQPSITLKKYTNGEDADTPPGPFVPLTTNGAPTPITWSYVVTNTGNTTLNTIAVTDDQGVAVSCPGVSLAPSEEMVCTAQGVVADPATLPGGFYANNGTVTARDTLGTAVTATDPSHYTPTVPGISVVKSINQIDANIPPGLRLSQGTPLLFTYLVTNTGTSPLDNIVLVDDVLGPITCPQTTLAVGASMTCTATSTAQPGFNQNVATVTGRDTILGSTVTDTDPASYFGEAPAITLVKTTNGDDANTPPGPLVTVGGFVFWNYTFTNTGNVPLRWQLTDDQGVAIACPRLLFLRVGGSITCHGAGAAQAGQYANVGTVEGTTLGGLTVSASDPSHYFGVQGGIDVVKLTNGDDANDPPGPFIPVGGGVTWTYRVTNTGNTDLTDVGVTDSRGVAISCPATTLASGASMDCTATGSAEPGQYVNNAMAQGTTPTGVVVEDQDPSAYFGAESAITVSKMTNGVEADELPGPFIPVGDPVEWTYIVTNTGNSPLTAVTVTDDQGVAVNCPQTALAPQEQMTCTGTGTSNEGQYANIAIVTGEDPTGTLVGDEDPSNYYGAVSAITMRKLVNGVEAPQPTGPILLAGSAVTWTYLVENTGNIAVKNLTVTDDKGVKPVFVSGDANGNADLDPGEIWTYQATGTAVPGQYTNVATANGLDALEDPVTATAQANYFATGAVGPASTLPAVGAPADTLTMYALVVVAGGVALIVVASRRRAHPRSR